MLLAFAVLAGCGAEVYESRLNETKKYFAYLDRLNRELSPAWTGSGISYRAPQVFRPIPPPRPEKDAEGNVIEPTSDPRQPEFIEGELPGLVGTWQAPVKAEAEVEGEREIVEVPAYLFLLSNYSLWADGDIEKATGFADTAVRQISGDLIVRIAPEMAKQTRYPSGTQGTNYVEPRQFTTWDVLPDKEIHGTKYTASVYVYRAGDMQVVLLALLPRNTTSPPLLAEKVLLSLETLNVSNQKPRRSEGGAGGGGGGSEKRGANF